MNKQYIYIIILIFLISLGCNKEANPAIEPISNKKELKNKKVVYQVFTRLFGNTNTTNKPWGTIEENGVGKFNDFTDKALNSLCVADYNSSWYLFLTSTTLSKHFTNSGTSSGSKCLPASSSNKATAFSTDQAFL